MSAKIEIKPLKMRDLNQARKFAVTGMNLARYADNTLVLALYSRYFIWKEAMRATHALGAYQNGRLVGAVMAVVKDEQPLFHSLWRKYCVTAIEWLKMQFFGQTDDAYDEANDLMLFHYMAGHHVDGELNFFAVNPAIKGKGIGSLLLNALEEKLAGKNIYLYTDSGCTYQFYQQRGFAQVGHREVEIDTGSCKVPLTCMLFAKRFV